MKISKLYKGFLLLIGLLLLANLLVMNEFTTVLPDGEVPAILAVQQHVSGLVEDSGAGFQIPKFVSRMNYRDTGFNAFFLRLPNVLLLILTLAGFYWFGKKLFGQKVVLSTLLVLSSTFLIIPLAKFMVYDIWLLAFLSMAFLFLILLLKQGLWQWRILFWLAVIGGIFTSPVSTLLFANLCWLFFALFHKNKKHLNHYYDWGFWVLVYLLIYSLDLFSLPMEGFVYNYKELPVAEYFLHHILALLPWIGFLPAALWDLFKKLRRKDEMAMITFVWLFFGMLSFSLIFQLALVFLLGKQVINYFQPNYPYRNLVKSFSILNLILSFFGLLALLLGGYAIFDAIGYRSLVGLSMVYWAFGFIAILGLIGHNRKMIVGGMTLSGIFAMLMFWIQVNPLVDYHRNLAKKLVYEIKPMLENEEKDTKVFLNMNPASLGEAQGIDFFKQFEVYMNADSLSFERTDKVDPPGIYILNPENIPDAPENRLIREDKIVKGYSHLLGPEQEILILKVD